MKRWEDKTFVHVSEGSSHLAEIFAVLHFHADSQRETPIPGAGGGACSCPAGLPAPKGRACSSPTPNHGEGEAPLPPCGLAFAAPANSAPRFHEYHRPETTSIYASSSAFAQSFTIAFSTVEGNRNCLHPQPAGSLPCKTGIFGVQKPRCMLVTQF